MATRSFKSHRESMAFGEQQMSGSTPTLYIPTAAPPTPSPSPVPGAHPLVQSFSGSQPSGLPLATPAVRREYLAYVLSQCTPSELLFISTTIAPLLKRDFLCALPTEISLHILTFVSDPKALARAGQVSRRWRSLVQDESVWKRMCKSFDFEAEDPLKSPDALISPGGKSPILDEDEEPLEEMERFATLQMDPALEWITAKTRAAKKERMKAAIGSAPSALTFDSSFSYRRYFQHSFTTMMNWRHGGHLLRCHRVGITSPDVRASSHLATAAEAQAVSPAPPPADLAVVTSVALDSEWVVVGLANHRIHVFSVRTGVLSRTLIGHELGVWVVNLVSRGGYWGGSPQREGTDGLAQGMADASLDGGAPPLDHLVPPPFRIALGLDRAPGDFSAEVPTPPPTPWPGKRSDVSFASEGWGQPGAIVVSGGCDKVLRIWDLKTGHPIYILHGHTSTIRCMRMLHNRPIAITGSRDTTLRVWDVQKGRLLRVLQGHQQSVRCLDICGNRVVSGSYDTTCRIWDADTGECLHVLRGHAHQIYSVAFDGVRIASGGLDTTVRVWDAETGICLALLQAHTALVCQLQLSPTILATGGSDGRVITFSLDTFAALQRIMAHDSSVTSLQFDKNFLVTGGNDGRVRLFETKTGVHVRDLSEQCDSVWKVACGHDVCAVMCRRHGKTVMEIWSFKPRGD